MMPATSPTIRTCPTRSLRWRRDRRRARAFRIESLCPWCPWCLLGRRLELNLRRRARQPYLRHPESIHLVDPQLAAFEGHRIADLGAVAQSSQHVAADRGVGRFIDMQSELRIDVGGEREAVDIR